MLNNILLLSEFTEQVFMVFTQATYLKPNQLKVETLYLMKNLIVTRNH